MPLGVIFDVDGVLANTESFQFPDIYLSAANSLGLKPADCLAFEDTKYGVNSAISAGLLCFAIPNEFSQQQNFSKADGVFKNLKEAIYSIS